MNPWESIVDDSVNILHILHNKMMVLKAVKGTWHDWNIVIHFCCIDMDPPKPSKFFHAKKASVSHQWQQRKFSTLNGASVSVRTGNLRTTPQVGTPPKKERHCFKGLLCLLKGKPLISWGKRGHWRGKRPMGWPWVLEIAHGSSKKSPGRLPWFRFQA